MGVLVKNDGELKMSLPVNYSGGLTVFEGKAPNYLSEDQVNRLTLSFQTWYDDKGINDYRRFFRGRYWLVYLLLRFTGARVSEVYNLKLSDIDFRNAEIKLITLKRHNPKKKGQYRIVPVPTNVVAEISNFIMFAQNNASVSFKSKEKFDRYMDNLFTLKHQNFHTVFKERCKEADIPDELAHPHILRHTRAIELLRAGVPVTIVQDILGHSALTTTAIYLKMSGQEAKSILKDKGLL